ncbi:segregation/condensation protein A [Candidatus Woesearchaeota archaeon]|nr:segregation/condensation protein A [Candidatus Woesearchaeota archaeon]
MSILTPPPLRKKFMQQQQQQVFSLLLDQDEVTWQSIIYELIKTEQMDPWDIDISELAKKFLVMLKKFKEADFRISGKVLLAAALLLRLKSDKFVGEDMQELDRLIAATEQTGDEFYEELEQEQSMNEPLAEEPHLLPRTPQPRKRKVSVFDLVEALEKALEVQQRRTTRIIPEAPVVKAPEKTTDMTVIIKDVYHQVRHYFLVKRVKRLTFSQLLPSQKKEDKVYTFIPLLHLTNQRKIDLEQEQHFGEIEILLTTPEKEEVVQ